MAVIISVPPPLFAPATSFFACFMFSGVAGCGSENRILVYPEKRITLNVSCG